MRLSHSLSQYTNQGRSGDWDLTLWSLDGTFSILIYIYIYKDCDLRKEDWRSAFSARGKERAKSREDHAWAYAEITD